MIARASVIERKYSANKVRFVTLFVDVLVELLVPSSTKWANLKVNDRRKVG
jgi:hypothetical protein